MKKTLLFAVAALALALLPSPGMAETYTVSMTQIVEHPSLDAMQKGVVDRFKEKGVDAKFNIHVAQGDPSIALQIANQIMGEQPDLAIAITTPSAQTVMQKVKGIPIVFTGVTDPVGAGLVASLEHPGGMVTGMTDMSPMDKHLQLVRDFVPNLKSLGVIYNAGEPNSVVLINLLKKFAAEKGVKVEEATIATSAEVYQAAKSLVGRCQAVYVPVDNTVVSALESAVKVCRENKLPLFTGDTDSVSRGSVAALAVDYYKMGVQTADMAIRILVDGEKPADMPVESIKDLQLYVNKSATKAMGLTLSPELLKKADKIIE